MKQIQMPVKIPAIFEIFEIPNLTILPEPSIQNPQNKEKTLQLESIMNLNTKYAMITFTYGSAPSNPGPVPVGAGVVIKNKRPKSTPVKLAKVVKQMGTSYGIEAIKLAVGYANEKITSAHDNLHIYSDSQAAILSIASQDSENYHNSMIWQIREYHEY